MGDDNSKAQININEARVAAEKIKTISRNLDGIFEEWRTLVMRCINDPTKYSGQTRDAYERTFSSLRTSFTNFVSQVNQKSNELTGHAGSHETRDRQQAAKAEEIAKPIG